MSIEVQNFLNDSGGNFTETAPRPPVPGEENELQSNGGTSTRSSGSHKSQISSKSHSSGKSHKSESSPAATPRRSNLDRSSTQINRSNPKLDGEDVNAPLGFEPEGSAASSPPFTENSTPQYLKWAENLNLLLEDSDGVKLFKEFLDQERCSNTLDFWFACRGLKMVKPTDDIKITAIVKLIYKKFFKTDQLHFKHDTKRTIIDRINRKEYSQSIFDNAQKEIEELMQSETYPLFLKSDLYVQYIQAGGDSPKTSNTSSGSNSVRPVSGPLPPVQENSILRNEDLNLDESLNRSQHNLSGVHFTLTPESLLATLNTRQTPYHRKEGAFLQPLPPSRIVNPYHISYTTTSAQDSELQSLSSDAHTDDTMSQTDSSIDGRDVPYPGSKKWRKNRKIILQNVKHNQHTSLTQTIIPRTERAPKDRNVAETDPSKFANLLIEKLERVKDERDKVERVKESLSSLEKDDSTIMPPPVVAPVPPKSVINNSFNTSSMNNSSMNILPLSTLINSLTEPEEDNAQSILEQHCSRIWQCSNDQTPSRSPPGRHRSPDHNGSFRGIVAGPTPNTSGVNLFGRTHHKKRDKDTFNSSGILSAMSYDSGMGEDRSGIYHHHNSDHKHTHHHHHHHVVSGKDRGSGQGRHMNYYRSDPNMQARGHTEPLPGDMGDPLARGRSRDARRTSAKKTSDSSSNIDSGVSLHYDISPHQVPSANDPSNEKVLAWMTQNDRMSNSSTAQYSTDGSDKGSSQHKRSSHKSVSSSASPAPHRSSRKLAGYQSGRSGSMDRSGHLNLHDTSAEYQSMVHHGAIQPLQPIMQDSSMPLLNPPNPTTQLEEAKRLLEDETKQRLSKSKSFDGRSSSSSRRSTMLAMVPPSNYPPLPPRSLNVSKSIPSGAAGPHDISSSEESSKSESKKTSGYRRPSSSAPATPAQEVTVVGYYFCDEPIPYRTTLPGKQITLAMFKNLITKKGNYRYYFKMACEDFDSGVIMEEVSDDNSTLPLWEGKIVGKVKKIE